MKYQLIEIRPKNKTFEVFIKADSNDADYISTLTSYSEEKFNKNIVDDLILLQSKYAESHKLEKFENAVYDTYDRDTELDIPCSDFGVCHTLEELKITCIDIDGQSYNVKLIQK